MTSKGTYRPHSWKPNGEKKRKCDNCEKEQEAIEVINHATGRVMSHRWEPFVDGTCKGKKK